LRSSACSAAALRALVPLEVEHQRDRARLLGGISPAAMTSLETMPAEIDVILRDIVRHERRRPCPHRSRTLPDLPILLATGRAPWPDSSVTNEAARRSGRGSGSGLGAGQTDATERADEHLDGART